MANSKFDYADLVQKSVRGKRLMNKLFVAIFLLLELLILLGIVLSISAYFKGEEQNIFTLVAMSLMLLWFGILIAYLAWSIYFYNVNLGLTNQDWAEIRKQKAESPEKVIDERTLNPNANQTLGLPVGTVRGSIALTLLIGGMSMAIAALGMDAEVKQDSFIVDHFEFFKTAFLMMIAFYFGNKSLDVFSKKTTTEVPASNVPKNPESTAGLDAGFNGIVASEVDQQTQDNQDADKDEFNNPNAVQ